MKDKFENYLDNLSLSKVIKKRVKEVMNLNAEITNVEILDIFICDMKDKEGAKSYTSLWLFADAFVIECKNFLSMIDFDITPYKDRMSYCSIKAIEFDFKTFSSKSSVTVHCRIGVGGDMKCNLIATEANCIEAFKIYQRYFISNLQK